MLLTTRVATLQTGVSEGIELALEAVAIVNAETDLGVSVFVGGAGYAPNTFLFSSVVEGMSAISAGSQKLMASKKYAAFTKKVAPLMSDPGASRLRAIVAMAPETPEEIPVGAAVSAFTATMKGPKLAEAMTFGAEIAAYYHQETGSPIAFLRNVAGNVGELVWLGVLETAADLDKALEWEATDAGYQERYASAGDLFIEGSAHRAFMTRLG